MLVQALCQALELERSRGALVLRAADSPKMLRQLQRTSSSNRFTSSVNKSVFKSVYLSLFNRFSGSPLFAALLNAWDEWFYQPCFGRELGMICLFFLSICGLVAVDFGASYGTCLPFFFDLYLFNPVSICFVVANSRCLETVLLLVSMPWVIVVVRKHL